MTLAEEAEEDEEARALQKDWEEMKALSDCLVMPYAPKWRKEYSKTLKFFTVKGCKDLVCTGNEI